MTPRMILAAVAFAVYATYIAVLRYQTRRHRTRPVTDSDTLFVVSVTPNVASELGYRSEWQEWQE